MGQVKLSTHKWISLHLNYFFGLVVHVPAGCLSRNHFTTRFCSTFSDYCCCPSAQTACTSFRLSPALESRSLPLYMTGLIEAFRILRVYSQRQVSVQRLEAFKRIK